MIKICEMFEMIGELNVELLFLKTSTKPKRYLLKVHIVKFRPIRKYWVLLRFILECLVTGGHEGKFKKG